MNMVVEEFVVSFWVFPFVKWYVFISLLIGIAFGFWAGRLSK